LIIGRGLLFLGRPEYLITVCRSQPISMCYTCGWRRYRSKSRTSRNTSAYFETPSRSRTGRPTCFTPT